MTGKTKFHKLVLIKNLVLQYKVALTLIIILLSLTFITTLAGSLFFIRQYGVYILPARTNKRVRVGLVLGAGINSKGKPYTELKARLDSAALALSDGTVDKLILSGDNRFEDYNEPAAMRNYLIKIKGVDANRLQPDYAGRSTYESCERAAKVFNVKQTIIFSAGSHLPRAIYLCRHFGIETYGISSNVEADNSSTREPLADVKAIFNVILVGEPTILDSKIVF